MHADERARACTVVPPSRPVDPHGAYGPGMDHACAWIIRVHVPRTHVTHYAAAAVARWLDQQNTYVRAVSTSTR
jgi:hypothetical protein